MASVMRGRRTQTNEPGRCDPGHLAVVTIYS